MSKSDKIQQRYDWLRFRMTTMGYSQEFIDHEFDLIIKGKFEALEVCHELMDFKTYQILGGK